MTEGYINYGGSVFRSIIPAVGPSYTITSLSVVSLGFAVAQRAESFFTVDVFPSLKALAISPCIELHTKEHFFPSLPLPLLQQLKMLQVECELPELIPSSLFSTDTPVLYGRCPPITPAILEQLKKARFPRLRIVAGTDKLNWETYAVSAAKSILNISALISPSRSTFPTSGVPSVPSRSRRRLTRWRSCSMRVGSSRSRSFGAARDRRRSARSRRSFGSMRRRSKG